MEIKYTDNALLHIKAFKAEQFDELFRQGRLCKVSNRSYPLQPNVCVLNF